MNEGLGVMPRPMPRHPPSSLPVHRRFRRPLIEVLPVVELVAPYPSYPYQCPPTNATILDDQHLLDAGGHVLVQRLLRGTRVFASPETGWLVQICVDGIGWAWVPRNVLQRDPQTFAGLYGLPDDNGDNMITDLEIAVGLAAANPFGFGIVGPFGDADSIDPGDYKITGWPVNLRADPGGKVIGSVQGGINESGVAAPSQDVISTDGKVERRYVAGQTTVPYAHVVKVNDAPKEGWVAVRYLAPMSWEPPAGVPPPPPPPKPGPITPVVADGVEKKPTDYTAPILIGAGVLAVGVIGWAVLAPKRKRRRLARAA